MKKSIFDKVKKADTERKEKISSLKDKVNKLAAERDAAKEGMTEAMEKEDLKSYSECKRKAMTAEDALDVFGGKLDALQRSALFGEEQASIISQMVKELNEYETEICAEVLPLFEKILSISEVAVANYCEKAQIIDAMYKDAGLNGSGPIALKLNGINHRVRGLIESTKENQR